MSTKESAINHLVTWLERGNEADRFYAIQTLAHLKAEQASNQLINCLGDQDEDVCTEAAIALGELQCNAAVPVLKQAIKEHDLGDVKIAATQAIAKIGNQDAIDVLLEFINHNPMSNSDDFVEDWDDYWDIQRTAVIAVGDRKVAQAVPLLVDLFSSEECQDLEPELFISLAKIGETGIQFLLELLLNASARTVRRIMMALAKVDPTYYLISLKPVLSQLSHQDNFVRLACCKTLMTFAQPAAIADLAKLFADNDSEVAEAAIRAVISIAKHLPDGLKAISPHMLLSLAKGANPNARKALLKIANEMSQHNYDLTSADTKFLVKIMTQDDQTITELSAQLLFKEKQRYYQPLLIELFCDTKLAINTRRQLLQCYANHIENSEKSIKPLLKLLDEDDNITRTAVIEIIAKTANLSFEGEINPAEKILYHLVVINDYQHALTESNTLKGKIKTAQIIPTITLDDNEETNKTLNSPAELEALMAKSQLNPANALDEVQDKEENRLVTSTLDSLRMVSSNTASVSNSDKIVDQDQQLRTLLAQQPEEMQSFNDIIDEHLKSSEALGYSKKKVARIAFISNQVLAAQALAYYPVKNTIALILESLRIPQIALTTALLTALERIISQNTRLSELSNIIGICSTLAFGGNDEIQRLAAKILGSLKHRQAIPALHYLLTSNSATIVKIQAINALADLLSLKAKNISTNHYVVRDEDKDESRDEKTIRLVCACFSDKEYGVRKAAIHFVQRHKIPLIDELIITGCADAGVLAETSGFALRTINKEAATQALLISLEQSQNFSVRRALFKQIECLYLDTNQDYYQQ